jgi:L-aminopeptidase/D-esterase-like protein
MMPSKESPMIPGFRVGHAQDLAGCTGCTVVLCPDGTTGGVDIRGSASGTRELDALSPLHLVPHVHAVLLAGGSAFGLDAAAGVMRFLEARGVGFDVQVTRVPIVPTAILFDLRLGSHKVRPDADMAYAACEAALEAPIAEGCVGAGTGATVGKLLGVAHATKSGLGTARVALAGGLEIGAMAVVNAFGDVRDPATGQLLAGARSAPERLELIGMLDAMRRGAVPRAYRGESTTLAVVVTNAQLTKSEATKVAQVAQHGLVRTIGPVHTTLDGDLVIVLATGRVRGDQNLVGIAAADAVAEAVVRGVTQAVSLGGLPAWRDLDGAGGERDGGRWLGGS